MAVETEQALQWCVDQAEQNCMIRLVISPSPRTIVLPDDYRFTFGRGSVINDGKDAILFAYGPVMMNEALTGRRNTERTGCFPEGRQLAMAQ